MAPNPINSPQRFKNAEAGFSLLELLVVAALLIILSATYLSHSSKDFQRSKQVECANQLQFIHSSLQMYATDHGGQYPKTNSATTSEQPLSLLIPTATTRTELFICPGTRDSTLPAGRPFASGKISYAYLMGLTNGSDPGQWIMADALYTNAPAKIGSPVYSQDGKGRGRNHAKFGGNVLFLDGHTTRSAPLASFDLPQPPGTQILNPKR